VKAEFAAGLVVGKFSPRHAGHEALLAHALERCERLFILSYSNPEFARCEAATRRRWLEQRYPMANVLVLDSAGLAALARSLGRNDAPRLPANDSSDEEQRDFVLWLCRHAFCCQVDAVFTSELYGDGFAAHLARGFGSAVRHICFDLERQRLPVSGTRLRAESGTVKQWTAALVNADLVGRLVIFGGESSGKSTLAVALAGRLATGRVDEYGRELWLQRGGQLSYADLLQIGRVQLEREDLAAQGADRWLVCDTSPLTTLYYCLDMFGKAPAELWRLSTRPYDLTFVCAPDFAFVQDGTRRDQAFRQAQHEWYLETLSRCDIAFTVLEGSVEQRLQQALQRIENHEHP
jgi:HTH-type transcriptional repressor of NAD biosynthesis genes